jgi:hypothetical protein
MQDPIHQRYQDIAKEFATGRILKTDVWQETRDKYEAPIRADDYIELLPDLVAEAQKRGLKAIQGDITKMPYADGEFDTVIDTSTIDHVADYHKVINEYARVTKDKLLLIVWLTSGITMQEGGDLAGGKQYYFNEDDFVESLKWNFNIENREVLRDAGNRRVVAFRCRKL